MKCSTAKKTQYISLLNLPKLANNHKLWHLYNEHTVNLSKVWTHILSVNTHLECCHCYFTMWTNQYWQYFCIYFLFANILIKHTLVACFLLHTTINSDRLHQVTELLNRPLKLGITRKLKTDCYVSGSFTWSPYIRKKKLICISSFYRYLELSFWIFIKKKQIIKYF